MSFSNSATECAEPRKLEYVRLVTFLSPTPPLLTEIVVCFQESLSNLQFMIPSRDFFKFSSYSSRSCRGRQHRVVRKRKVNFGIAIEFRSEKTAWCALRSFSRLTIDFNLPSLNWMWLLMPAFVSGEPSKSISDTLKLVRVRPQNHNFALVKLSWRPSSDEACTILLKSDSTVSGSPPSVPSVKYQTFNSDPLARVIS